MSYDKLLRRTSLSYGNATSASYAYTDRGDLTDLDWDLSGTAADFSYDFTYNGVGQLTSQSLNDSLLKWSPAANDNDSYTPNGLNQYADIDGATPVYDGNGNTTTDHHGRGLEYDAENMLAVVRDAPAGTALLSVSPWADGTMRLSDAGGTVSRYYFDGDHEIAETDDVGGVDLADNQILWRYLRLPGAVDEVIKVISYNANGTTAWQKFAHADRLGSTRRLSWASSGYPSGADVYQYSPYGESGPEGDTGFAFRFTGQKLFASVGLYYYKARWYDPETGRFMQTDPIGYEDQMNLYAYVGNDPVNRYDSTGECSTGSRLGENSGCNVDFDSFAAAFNEKIKQKFSSTTDSDDNSSADSNYLEEDDILVLVRARPRNGSRRANRRAGGYRLGPQGIQYHLRAFGHTSPRHIGRSQQQLETRLKREPRLAAASSFYDLPSARVALRFALTRNRNKIDRWIRNGQYGSLDIRARGDFGYVLRRGAKRPDRGREAVFVLRENQNLPGGFEVYTGYVD